jgi:hypothetical protein
VEDKMCRELVGEGRVSIFGREKSRSRDEVNFPPPQEVVWFDATSLYF